MVMKKTPRLVGFVLVGILASAVVLLLIELTGIYDDAWGFVGIFRRSLIVIPLCLAVGSMFTGFLSQPYVQIKTGGYLLLAPGFYYSVVLNILFSIYEMRFPGQVHLLGFIEFFWAFSFCIISSIFGVYVGSKIRAKKR